MLTPFSVTYSSNNSGGSFWLSTKDWEGLRKAGWTIEAPSWCGEPTGASKQFEARDRDTAEGLAIAEFDAVTSQTASDEGCSCCGPPHNFYASEVSA